MKKLFLILVAIVGFGICANAQCTVSIDNVRTTNYYVWVGIHIENCSDYSEFTVRITPSSRISHLLKSGSESKTYTLANTTFSGTGGTERTFDLKEKTDYNFSIDDFRIEVISKERRK